MFAAEQVAAGFFPGEMTGLFDKRSVSSNTWSILSIFGQSVSIYGAAYVPTYLVGIPPGLFASNPE